MKQETVNKTEPMFKEKDRDDESDIGPISK